MIFDRMLSFFENETVSKTASTVKKGRIVDLRLNGELAVKGLNVLVMAVGTAPSAAVTTVLETSATGADNSFSALGTQTSSGNVLYKGEVPLGCKRYLRAKVTVGGSNMTADIKVKGGIVVGDVEVDGTPTLQAFAPTEASPHSENIAAGAPKGSDGAEIFR